MIEALTQWISSDNTQKIQYIFLYFIFLFALSHKMFDNVLGCKLHKYTQNKYMKHLISILFLFLIVDTNFDAKDTYTNPIMSFGVTVFIYALGIILLNSHQLYIMFIIGLIFCLILLEKYKSYLHFSVQDQELKQEHLNFIYKTNNVAVILMILAIVIGSLTSFQHKETKKCKMI
tara:strand:+ start:196 stop:720 length:525 start_codon:yes stop_codon:yes gene_type:complete